MMTVEQIIKQLKELDPKAEVLLVAYNFHTIDGIELRNGFPIILAGEYTQLVEEN